MSTQRFYQPVAAINGEDIALAGFSFSAPVNALDVSATVQIADVNTAVARGDEFDLLIKIPGGAEPKSRLIKNGRVTSFNKNTTSRRLSGYSAPNDSLSIIAVDKIGERWKYSSRPPIILYDPQYVTIQEEELDTNVNDVDGNRIFATARQVGYLDLLQILNFAYVESCGFDAVETNLPNYRIPRADFALNTSFHTVASSFYAQFRPLVWEFDDRLFIMDVEGEIPAGMLAGAREVHLDGYITFDNEQPETQVVNAALISIKQIGNLGPSEFDGTETFRTEPDPPTESGSLLTLDYRKETFTRFIAEFHDDEDEPDKITGEAVWKTELKTEGQDESFVIRELSRETQIDHYSHSWRLKIGFTKTVQAYVEDGSGGKSLRDVLTETNILEWDSVPGKFGEYDKKRSITKVEGLVLVDGEFTTDAHGNAIFAPETIATPLLDASRNKQIPDDGSMEIIRKPISSKTEVWRYSGADQIEVHIQEQDLLTNRLKRSGTIQHIGTNAARVRLGESSNTKPILLVDEASELADGPREPISLDFQFIPYALAKELGFREMAFIKNPPKRVSWLSPTYDAGISRASVRKVFDRDGNYVVALVTGLEVTGSQKERAMLAITQTIQGVVIG